MYLLFSSHFDHDILIVIRLLGTNQAIQAGFGASAKEGNFHHLAVAEMKLLTQLLHVKIF